MNVSSRYLSNIDGSRVQNESSKKGRKSYGPKSFEYNSEDRVCSLNVKCDKKYQASSKKFRLITNKP